MNSQFHPSFAIADRLVPKDMNRTTQTKLCHALSVLLLTLLLLCVNPTACRPSTENEGDSSTLPPGADNIEVLWRAETVFRLSLELSILLLAQQIHHVEVVDGINHEDHPVIMYKEDFVNEDYGKHWKHLPNDTAQRELLNERETRLCWQFKWV